jgi:pyroglutamyl-peptidase
MRAAGETSRPRVLVTGFEAFPGAPVNPTEALVAHLRKRPPRIAGISAFAAEVLPVDYRAIGPRLSEIGNSFRPDIAVHFGLAQSSRGLRLERVARNSFRAAPADNLGFAPPDGPICIGDGQFASTLPLARIHASLSAAGLPAEWSDNAGNYLCNTVFALSAGRGCACFSPVMTGFIHVPPVGRGQVLQARHLDHAIRIIVVELVAEWSEL